MGTWVYIVMVIIVFAARFAVDKLIDATSPKVRFVMTMILIVLYTLFMEGFTYLTYEQPMIKDNFYQSMIVGIALINFVVLLVAIFYYFMRKRRKLSDVDKMKLKDL